MSISGIKNNAPVYSYAKSGSKPVNTSDMTIGEYKSYIYNKISDMQNNGSKSMNYIAVDISEEGFRAMKSDSNYENLVLDQLRSAFDENVGLNEEGSYIVYHIGANRNEIYCEKWKAEKLNKKKLNEKIEQDEQRKRKLKKQQMAKAEHYAQYKKALLENSLRKSKIELEHIRGDYDDRRGASKNMNAIASYRAIMNNKMN